MRSFGSVMEDTLLDDPSFEDTRDGAGDGVGVGDGDGAGDGDGVGADHTSALAKAHTGGHTPWSAKAHKADHTSALAKAHTGGHTPGGDGNKRKKEHQDFCKRQKELNASKCEVKKEEEGGEASVAPKPDESWPKPSYLEHLIVDHGTSSSRVYDGPDITFQSFSDAVKGRATKFQKGRMYWLAPDEYQVAGPGRGIFWPKDRWCYEFFFGKKVSLTDRHGEPLWD
jgi:hypothetical protein